MSIYSLASRLNSKEYDLDAKAPLNSPTFTGTVNGLAKAMVGLGNVDNTSDALKPVSRDALNDGQPSIATSTSLTVSSIAKSTRSCPKKGWHNYYTINLWYTFGFH